MTLEWGEDENNLSYVQSHTARGATPDQLWDRHTMDLLYNTQVASHEPSWWSSGREGVSKIVDTTGVMIGSLFGLTIGIALKSVELSADTLAWLSFPGELFLMSLRALVVPLVFTTLVVSICELLVFGQQKGIGKVASLFFVGTSFIAASEGILWGMVARPLFRYSENARTAENELAAKDVPLFALRCQNGKFLERITTSLLSSDEPLLLCVRESVTNASTFVANDINGAFDLQNDTEYSFRNWGTGVSDEQAQNLLRNIFPSNFIESFAQENLVSVVSLAVVFGIALAALSFRLTARRRYQEKESGDFNNLEEMFDDYSKPKTEENEEVHGKVYDDNHVLRVFQQLNRMLVLITQRILQTTPLAIVFLLASMIAAGQDDSLNVFYNIIFFTSIFIAAQITHAFVILPLLYVLLHRKSPCLYMRKMVPAMVFGFGSASSHTTAPVTIHCLHNTKKVSRTLVHYVIKVGTRVNMDGMALYLPLATIFILQTSGSTEALSYYMRGYIVLASVLLSIGAAPVPNSGLIMVLALWSSIAGEFLPVTFPMLVMLEFIEDRFQTVTNVIGTYMVALVIAPYVGETYSDEQRRKGNWPDGMAREEEREEMDTAIFSEQSVGSISSTSSSSNSFSIRSPRTNASSSTDGSENLRYPSKQNKERYFPFDDNHHRKERVDDDRFNL